MSVSSIWAWLGDFHLGSAIAGALVTQLLAVIIALIVWLITKPRLTFETGPEIPFLLVAPRHDSPTGLARWIRVRVKNRGWRDAHCRVYLTDIIKEGEKEPILKEDAIQLWASAGGEGRDPYEPLTISRGFSRFFDIGYIPGDDLTTSMIRPPKPPPPGTEFRSLNHLNLASDEFEIRHPQPLPPGIYKFRIAASGTNFHPITRTVQFHFDDANTVKVSPIGVRKKWLRLISRKGDFAIS
jgi:hypothetical protein